MKKHLAVISLFLLTAISMVSCKKDTESLKARMIGKWSLSKIEVTGYTDPLKNGTFTYGQSDQYMDFKGNVDDQVELSLSTTNRTIGTYISTGEQFVMSFPNEGDSYCTVNNLTANQFQFTAKIDKSNVVKVYYLTK
ncbi:hypothetical protein [Pedobacter sp. MW01-1-1]|uniref:hypothetical protein n=1 Tax=Pedobacter sp. MW01-1-1 TaxID=3383027 RepID=UPI003FED5A1A